MSTGQQHSTEFSHMPFLLIVLSLLSLPVMAQTKYIIQWRDQFGKYHNYQTQYGRTSAYRTAEQRARNTDKVYRIVDGEGNLVDLFYP